MNVLEDKKVYRVERESETVQCDVCFTNVNEKKLQKGKRAFQQIDGNKHNWLKIHGAQRA
jgi:hypothetical protein